MRVKRIAVTVLLLGFGCMCACGSRKQEIDTSSEAYKAGFSAGYTDGYEEGYGKGYSAGGNAGFESGYGYGYDWGYNDREEGKDYDQNNFDTWVKHRQTYVNRE